MNQQVGYKQSASDKQNTGFAPMCYEVAYRRTKEAIREGNFISSHAMFQDLIAEDPFVWRHDGLIKNGIRRAMEDKL